MIQSGWKSYLFYSSHLQVVNCTTTTKIHTAYSLIMIPHCQVIERQSDHIFFPLWTPNIVWCPKREENVGRGAFDNSMIENYPIMRYPSTLQSTTNFKYVLWSVIVNHTKCLRPKPEEIRQNELGYAVRIFLSLFLMGAYYAPIRNRNKKINAGNLL